MRTFTHSIDALSQHLVTADVTCRGLWLRLSPISPNDVAMKLWGVDPQGNIDSNPFTMSPEAEHPIPIPLYRQPTQQGKALFAAQAFSGTLTIELLYDDFAAAGAAGPGKT